MTTDLVPIFDGKEIHIIEQSGNVWMPCRDLGLALGLDRTTLYQHVKRNRDFFEDCATEGDKLSQEGGDLWVNEQGLYLLLARISLKRINPLAKEAIKKFRKEVPTLVQKYRKKEIVQVPKGPDYPGIIEKIKFVKELSTATGWNLFELQKEVLNEAKLTHLIYHIEPEKPALPPAPPKPKDYLTATDIGERIEKSPHEVNMFLYQHKPPLLIKDQKGEWRITDYGKGYGEERMYEVSGGYFMWRIKWKKDVLRLFNIPVHEEMG
jgi:hypothetical protein